MAGMISPAILVAPWLFGVDTISAAAYTKAKADCSTVVSVSGSVNGAVRTVDNGETGRLYKNSMVGQMGSDDALSHLEVSAKACSGNLDLSARARFISRFNAFSYRNQDNAYHHCHLASQDGNNRDSAYSQHPSCKTMIQTSVLEIVVKDKLGRFGQLSIGKAPTGTSLSTKASFSPTSYTRGDVSNVYSVQLGNDDPNNASQHLGEAFGTYGLNHDQFRLLYSTAEYFNGLSLSAEYVSQSDDRTVGGGGSTTPIFPRHDSLGFSGSWKSSVNGIDLDLRAGYTSRAWEPYYRNGAHNDFVGTNGSYHLRGLGASAAFKAQGFDGSFAYAKLDPNQFLNRIADNFAANQPTDKHGEKAAVMNAFQLGYTFDLMGKETGLSGEYSTSKHFRNDDSKATIQGVRLAHKCTKDLTMHVVLQEHSFGGFKVEVGDFAANTHEVPKNAKVGVVGFTLNF